MINTINVFPLITLLLGFWIIWVILRYDLKHGQFIAGGALLAGTFAVQIVSLVILLENMNILPYTMMSKREVTHVAIWALFFGVANYLRTKHEENEYHIMRLCKGKHDFSIKLGILNMKDIMKCSCCSKIIEAEPQK